MKCDRCLAETVSTVMSMFNTDNLCMACTDEEKRHPDYQKAREAESAAVKRGEVNFRGIGLPADLQIKRINAFIRDRLGEVIATPMRELEKEVRKNRREEERERMRRYATIGRLKKAREEEDSVVRYMFVCGILRDHLGEGDQEMRSAIEDAITGLGPVRIGGRR